MAYSKAKLKSSDDTASPYFRPFWIGKLSEKYLAIWTLLHVSFKHNLINLTTFMGTPNSMRILYNTSLLMDKYNRLLYIYVLANYLPYCWTVMLAFNL
jgi:ABC-type branched-subunit amino acid transport system permease subunit